MRSLGKAKLIVLIGVIIMVLITGYDFWDSQYLHIDDCNHIVGPIHKIVYFTLTLTIICFILTLSALVFLWKRRPEKFHIWVGIYFLSLLLAFISSPFERYKFNPYGMASTLMACSDDDVKVNVLFGNLPSNLHDINE